MIFAYGPGIAHTIRTDPRHPMRKYYLDFIGTQAAVLIAATPLGAGCAVRVAESMELVDIYEAIDREARGDDEVIAKQLCATYLRLLLLKIRSRALEHPGVVPRAYTTYLTVRRFIEEHHVRLTTIEDVAAEMLLTPMYVARLFSRFGHTGAYRFLLRLRMNRAAEMLIDDGLLVKEVADQLGFPDAFTFSRAFKRIHGLPPSAVMSR
jgi:AraC-like DNA-binding protein